MSKKKIKAVLMVAPDWCRMSREVRQPFVDECKKLGVSFEVLDVENKDGLAMSIKYEVRNVPTMLVFKNGELIGREKGKYVADVVNCYI